MILGSLKTENPTIELHRNFRSLTGILSSTVAILNPLLYGLLSPPGVFSSVLESEFYYGIAGFDLAALHHLEVDAPQLEIFAGRGADELQGFDAEPGGKFLAAGMGLVCAFKDGRTHRNGRCRRRCGR